MRYAYKRTYNWSANIAYCVGLMASDGCLQKDGRHLDLTSVEPEQLTNFMVALGRKLPISTKKSGEDSIGFRVQFSDVAFYDFLKSVGLSPRKSHTMPALEIPDEFYADFLRGLFDGDGSAYGYFDKRWRSSYMFYVQYASASRSFIDYLRSMNQKLFGTTAGSVHPGKALTLSYAKADAYKLRSAMYYDDDVIRLGRKQSKLDGFVAADKAVIMCRDTRMW